MSIVSGPHAGKYGIVMGCKNGKLEICIRSDYKDDWDVIEVHDCRYLAEPPVCRTCYDVPVYPISVYYVTVCPISVSLISQ